MRTSFLVGICITVLSQSVWSAAGLAESQSSRLPPAAFDGDVDALQLLLEKGADINAKSEGQENTALHGAVFSRSTAALRLLLDKHADVNASNKKGETPLHLAVEKGTLGAIRTLLESGADCSLRDEMLVSPIRLAAIRGRADAYEIMLMACGGVEPSNAVDARLQIDQTVEALIGEATTNASPKVREKAIVGLVARGKEAVPVIAKHLDSGTPFNQSLYTVLERTGPVLAEKAVPELVEQLDDMARVVESRTTLNRLVPGYFESLPADIRAKAEAAHLNAVLQPSMGRTPMGPTYPYFQAVIHTVWLSDESLLRVLKEGDEDLRADVPCILDDRTDYSHSDVSVLRKLESALIGIAVDRNWILHSRVFAVRALGNLPSLSPATVDALLMLMASAENDDDGKKYFGALFKPVDLPESIGRTLVKQRLVDVRKLATFLTPSNNPSRVGAIAGLARVRLEEIPRMAELLGHKDPAIAAGVAVAAKRNGEKIMGAIHSVTEQEDEVRAPAITVIASALPKETVNRLVAAAISEEYSDRFRIAAARLAIVAELTGNQREQLVAILPVCTKGLAFADKARVYWATDILLAHPEFDSALPALDRYLDLYRKGAKVTLEYHEMLKQLESTVTGIRRAAEDNPSGSAD